MSFIWLGKKASKRIYLSIYLSIYSTPSRPMRGSYKLYGGTRPGKLLLRHKIMKTDARFSIYTLKGFSSCYESNPVCIITHRNMAFSSFNTFSKYKYMQQPKDPNTAYMYMHTSLNIGFVIMYFKKKFQGKPCTCMYAPHSKCLINHNYRTCTCSYMYINEH